MEMTFNDMTPLPYFLFISLGPLFPRIRVVGHWGIAGCLNDYLYLLCIQDCCSSEDSISLPSFSLVSPIHGLKYG